ncbi:hypothetical protein FE784_05135 [Paenibacillus hemerocallicola]|uniref:Uncharacterized protein n=1 Tax=Paenibacillus hemerocallicola TaxID=1172614 RepID=A0A5C4TE11_9BACL|nr:hypothetical protein [Paenibacillus hemerocallicola]TNJ67343.1 hypothetical protein FE784_05135 [Paenibacillus hemerocallicola]
MRTGDTFVVLLLIVVAIVWFYARGRLWYHKPRPSLAIPRQDEIFVPSEEAVRLLNTQGYEIVAGKTKLPITVTLDEQEMESRLFVDAFVLKDDEMYIVKLARERQPLEMSASAIRERLLVFSLLYPEAAGVLYVDPEIRSIRKITFDVERN